MSPAEYKAEYEQYLHHRAESELACQQLAPGSPQLQSFGRADPSVPPWSLPLPNPAFEETLESWQCPSLRPLCLLGVRLAALGGSDSPRGERPSHWGPAASVPHPESPIPLPFCPSGEMLEARYHESLSRLLPHSPLVPSPPVAPHHWREDGDDCAMEGMEDERSAHEPHATPLMRDSISPVFHPLQSPLMDISISAQLPRFDLECRKRSSAQPLDCSAPKRMRGQVHGW